MKIITFEKIAELGITPLQCYQWVADMIKNKENAILPAKISTKLDKGVLFDISPSIVMPVGGVKVGTRYPDRNPSVDTCIHLYDLSSGENIALLDGNWVTSMRTGAVAAHSIKLLAIEDFSVIGYIGLGNTARASLLVLLALYPDRKLIIKLKKYKNQHEQFAQRFSGNQNIIFQYCETYEEVIKESDVVVSAATFFETDICDDSCFKKGVLLVPIHTRGFSNCDLFFDKIFADDVNHVRGFKYFERFRYFAEVSDVINNRVKGRESNLERIIAYNIGISIHDVYFAWKIYELCGKECPEISLKASTQKCWI